MHRTAWLISLLSILLILSVAILQTFGFCALQEQKIIAFLRPHLPAHLLLESPRVVLITLESTPHGFQAMDVAMTLRGLSCLSPRCVLINGEIEPETGSTRFLPEIIGRMNKIVGLTLIIPHLPSPEMNFESIPLFRYSLTTAKNVWPKLEGKSSPGKGDAFLPQSDSYTSQYLLPFFAKTGEDTTIGSIWWWALPQKTNRKLPSIQPLLLFGKFLFLNHHPALHLTPSGSAISTSSGEILEMPLEDFLLQIEQKEQGTISPTFDNIWNNATVIIGRHEDVSMAASFSAILEETSRDHLPLWMFGTLLLMLMFVISARQWIIK